MDLLDAYLLKSADPKPSGDPSLAGRARGLGPMQTQVPPVGPSDHMVGTAQPVPATSFMAYGPKPVGQPLQGFSPLDLARNLIDPGYAPPLPTRPALVPVGQMTVANAALAANPLRPQEQATAKPSTVQQVSNWVPIGVGK